MPTYNSVIEIDASAGDGNSTQTLPVADFCLAAYYQYDGAVGATMNSLTINGVAMTSVIQLGDGANGDHTGTGVYVLDGYATGSQSVAWTWSNGGARSGGGALVLFFFDEETNPISVRDSAADGHASNTLSATVDSTVDDLLVILTSSYDANVVASAGTLRTSNPIEINFGPFGRGYTLDGSATSTTVTANSPSFGSHVMVSLQEVAAASSYNPTLTLLGVG